MAVVVVMVVGVGVGIQSDDVPDNISAPPCALHMGSDAKIEGEYVDCSYRKLRPPQSQRYSMPEIAVLSVLLQFICSWS